MHTPWGQSDTQEVITTRGIIFYGTPSHGGLHVCETLNKKIPEYMQEQDGWYEEDCAWAKVAIVFPQFFTKPHEAEQVVMIMKNYYPHEYEKFSGEKVSPNESYILRRELGIKESWQK